MNTERKKILVIEDNSDMRDNIAEILELANYEVITAPNGKEGIKAAKSAQPDLIVCDIMMPELDGYAVLSILSKDLNTADIPFIFLTAKAEKQDMRKGMEMGADDYLTKPFTDTDLINAIKARFEKHQKIKDVLQEKNPPFESIQNFFDTAAMQMSIDKLTKGHKTITVSKKDLLFREGKYPNALYYVVSGKVKAFRINEYGKEFIIDLYKPGDFIGYEALLEDTTYQFSAAVLEDADICVIPKEQFFLLLNNHKDVASTFIKLLSNGIKEKEERLMKMAYNSIRKRVAEALLLLIEKYKHPNDIFFSINMSRNDLSSLVGTATETLIRTLSDFKDEGIIEVKGSNIKVINEDKLRKLKG
ncbi:MAG: response regulator [Bacteroidia bacterium]|nr:response regulator [Bacteroidia bacterium]